MPKKLPDELTLELGLDDPDDADSLRLRVARSLGANPADLPELEALRQRGVSVPVLRPFHIRQVEVRPQRHRIAPGAMRGREHGIERVARREKLHGRAAFRATGYRFNERPNSQS